MYLQDVKLQGTYKKKKKKSSIVLRTNPKQIKFFYHLHLKFLATLTKPTGYGQDLNLMSGSVQIS